MEDFCHECIVGLFPLLAQAVQDTNGHVQVPVALTGFWLAIYAIFAALGTAVGAVAKNYYDDREKARAADIVKLRMTLGNDRLRRMHIETREYLKELARYLARIPGAPPGAPEPPAMPEHIHLEPDSDD